MRIWLAILLIALSGAVVLGANLALLGYVQPRNDPVGQLTPLKLSQIEASLGSSASINMAISPRPSVNQRVQSGERDDD